MRTYMAPRPGRNMVPVKHLLVIKFEGCVLVQKCGEGSKAAAVETNFLQRKAFRRRALAAPSDLFLRFSQRLLTIALLCGWKLVAWSRHAIGSCWTELMPDRKWNSPSMSGGWSSTYVPRTRLPWIDGDVQEQKVREGSMLSYHTGGSNMRTALTAVCEHVQEPSMFLHFMFVAQAAVPPGCS